MSTVRAFKFSTATQWRQGERAVTLEPDPPLPLLPLVAAAVGFELFAISEQPPISTVALPVTVIPFTPELVSVARTQNSSAPGTLAAIAVAVMGGGELRKTELNGSDCDMRKMTLTRFDWSPLSLINVTCG